MSKGWISIEGIIGAGKTSFIEAIKPYLTDYNVLVVPEPVEQWIEHGHLAASTTQPYVAQTYFFHTRIELFIKLLEQNPNPDYILSERSFETDLQFWLLSCKNGLTTELEQKTYPLLWKTWSRLLNGRKPTHYVYLRLDVDTAQQRVYERNRTEELSTTTNDYQKQLFDIHERFFAGKKNIFILDANRNFRDDPRIAKEMMNKILKF